VSAESPKPPAEGATPFRARVERRAGTAEVLAFRVGAELFALPLDAVEEAVELEVVHVVPESADGTLGVVELRGRFVPVLSPERALGVRPRSAAAMLVLRANDRRVGIAIDDVDDVITLDLRALRPPPEAGGADGVLLAVARRGADLVGVLDADLLLGTCVAEARTTGSSA
jgi:chemotaxis signal transduction protein